MDRRPRVSSDASAAYAREHRAAAALVLVAAVLIGFLLILLLRGEGAPQAGQVRAGGAASAGGSLPAAVARPGARTPGRGEAGALPSESVEAAGAEEDAGDARTLWERRLERAERTLAAYVEATQYPPGSRPMREHPDLLRPHAVAPTTLPLAREDRKLTDARVTLQQDRFFLVGDERVTLRVVCETSEGPAQCEVASSKAAPPPSEGGASRGPGEVEVAFSPEGDGGAVSATFQPAAAGFAAYHGTIRVSLSLLVDGEEGAAAFDMQYTPAAPARFTGKVREALDAGSLDLLVEMDVERAGRYVISGRADDAEGQTFAYMTFNEEVGEGRQEARLRLFGKLVLDAQARAPFRLRDVEGFLLKEDTSPDRELMAALEGTVHTTKRYASKDFSDAAWESEEKDRHIKEFTRDVDVARGRVEGGE